MPEILSRIDTFALLCLVVAAVLVPAYLLTRARARAAAEAGDDSPASAFFLWLHPDLCDHTGPAGDDEGGMDDGGE